MELDHDVHLVAHSIAYFSKRLQRGVQVLRADVLSVRLFSSHIKGPNLHARDAFAQKRLGHLVGAVQKALQVFVRPGALPQAPVTAGLVHVAADVLVARAGVVDANFVAAFAAQSGVQRHASGFAKNVPQRDVHRRISASLNTGPTPTQIARDVALA